MTVGKPLRIFLSYGHDSNEELVLRIHADLKKRGHDVWIDKKEIRPGDDWRREITEGILNSHQVLSFLSKHSTRDPGVCRDEIAIAVGVKGGCIKTILVESEQEVKPPVNISHVQWLDMHDWKDGHGALHIDKDEPVVGDATWEQWYQTRFSEIVRVVESEESIRFAGEIETLSGHLKPIQSEARICQLLNRGFHGRQWLFEAVEKWRQDKESKSRLFWIMGEPGVGKSAFAAQLTHTRGDTVIAAQFVEWDKPDHRNPERVVRSLAFQLATRLPDYRKLLLTLPEIAGLDRKNAADLFDYLIANPLKSSIGGGRERYVVVIDALDEAGDHGRNPLVEMLARDAGRLPDWLGIVVMSRPEFDVKTPLQALNPVPLDTQSESNRADIRDYLRCKLATLLRNRPNAERLVEQILAKSEGVFLYVQSFCEDIRRGHLSLDHPEEFPQGLGGKYYKDFKRYFPDVEGYRKDIRPALGAIFAAREPLPVEILQRLFSWDDDQLSDFSRALGSLFPVEIAAGERVIKAHHKSLSDWLADEAKAGQYFVSIKEGHSLLADAGWQEYRCGSPLEGSYFHTHLARHLSEAEQYDCLLDLVADGELRLFEKWVDRGDTTDGRFCLERLLSVVDGARIHSGISAALATQLARIDLKEGCLNRASALLQRALENATSDSPKRIVAIAAHEFGSVHFEKGDAHEARRWYRRSLKIARNESPSLDREISANLLGIAMSYSMTYSYAHFAVRRIEQLAKLALIFARGSGDIPHELEAIRILADVSKDSMNYDDAEAHLTSGLQKAQACDLPYSHMSLLTVKGWLDYQRAAIVGTQPMAAQQVFRELLKMAKEHRHHRYQADAWSGIGQCALLSGDPEIVREALEYLRGLPDEKMFDHAKVRCLLLGASLKHRRRDYMSAFIGFQEALALSTRAGIWPRQASAHVGCGSAKFCQGESRDAETHWCSAKSIVERCPPISRRIVERSIELSRRDPYATPL